MAGAVPAPEPTRRGYYAALLGYGSLAAAILAGGAILLAQLGNLSWLLPNLDFMGTYLGARLVATGQTAQLYDFETQLRTQAVLTAPNQPVVPLLYLYPGWNAVLFAPLGALPYGPAFLLWLVANLVAAVASVRALILWAARGRQRGILALAVAGFFPLALALATGQVTPLVLAGLTGSFFALRSGRERTAGLWLLLGLLKPQLVLVPLLMVLVGRGWRALLTFAAGALAALGGSLLVLGNWLPAYLRLLDQYVRAGPTMGDNPDQMNNWRTLVFRLFRTDQGPIAGNLILALGALSLLIVVGVSWLRPASHGTRWEIAFAVALLCGLLVDPHLYPYDTTVGLLAGLVLWREAAGPARRLRPLRAALVVGPFAAVCAYFEPDSPVEVASWYMVALLLTVAYAWPALPGHHESADLPPAIPAWSVPPQS